MKNIIIESKFDNYPLSILISEIPNPLGFVQIIHGMEEYKERYIKLIERLNNEGYSVIISDLRGHGHNVEKNDLGYFKKHKGNIALIKDQESILEYILNNYKNIPLLLFSHSMGTIIARNLLQNHNKDFKKVILCGPPYYQSACHFGILLASIICLFKDHKKAILLRNIAMKPYVLSVKNRKTLIDWISTNETNINNYLNDSFCGFGFKNNGYKTLFKLMSTMDNKLKEKSNLDILLISGKGDPVPGFTKGLNKIKNRLNNAGYTNEIKQIEYDHMRHEILNEKNNDCVYNDIINFFNK